MQPGSRAIREIEPAVLGIRRDRCENRASKRIRGLRTGGGGTGLGIDKHFDVPTNFARGIFQGDARRNSDELSSAG